MTEVKAQGEKQAGALITYLGGKAFKFYFSQLTVRGVLTDDANNNELVKEVLKEIWAKEISLDSNRVNSIYENLKRKANISFYRQGVTRV